VREDELETRPSWGRRLIGIEGLRGLAAVSVLVGHVMAHLASDVALGSSVETLLDLVLNGLTLFFVLSGFLLFRPFASAMITQARAPSIRAYARNRVLRIYPVYIVIFLVVALALGAAYTSSIPRGESAESAGQTVGRMSDPLDILTNLLMVHTLVPSSIKTGIGPSWSLTVELVFYVVMPILAALAYRLCRGQALPARVALAAAPAVVLLATGMLGSLQVRRFTGAAAPEDQFWLGWGDNWHAVFARSFLVHADLFAFGMLAAVVVVLVERGVIAGRGLAATKAVAAVGLVAGVLAARRLPLVDTWWALGCGALLLLVVLPTRHGGHSWSSRVLESLPLRYTGLVSYSLYLWHVPVIWLLDQHGFTAAATPTGFVLNIVLVFAVSMVLASATYWLVERPALTAKRPSVATRQAQALSPTSLAPAGASGPKRTLR
jgi:peptidoglycan/LPS O-acetylase OafA/YrhL